MAALERIYKFGFDNVTVSAVQDLLALNCSANNGAEIRRLSLSASGVTSPAEIRLRLKRMPATVTVGSGGSATTVYKINSRLQFATLSTSGRINDTTQATTSSTAEILATWNWNVLQDFLDVPPDPEERWGCAASESLIFDIIATPASTALSGYMVFEEA